MLSQQEAAAVDLIARRLHHVGAEVMNALITCSVADVIPDIFFSSVGQVLGAS